MFCFFVSDMSTIAFIEPLPVIDFVAQILGKDVYSRPMSDADRVKVYTVWLIVDSRFEMHIYYHSSHS